MVQPPPPGTGSHIAQGIASTWSALPDGVVAGGCLLAGAVLWLAWRNVRLTRQRDQLRLVHHQAERELAAHTATADALRERLQAAQAEHAELSDQLAQSRLRHTDLEHTLTELRVSHADAVARHQAWQTWSTQWQDQLDSRFQGLAAQVLAEQAQAYTATSRVSLQDLLQPLREQLDAFRRRVDDVHAQSVRGHESLTAAIRQVSETGARVGEQARHLSLTLRGDKQAAGSWGEMQLARALEMAGLIEGEHFQLQMHQHDGAGRVRRPDCVLTLPQGRHLVLDSKVSLVDYHRAAHAEDDDTRRAALDAHVRALRVHIDTLADKGYASLPDLQSPDFTLMFMPVESAYIDALRHDPTLFDHGARQRVILVSHTTLMPVLRTVANLWMLARSHAQADEISRHAGDIYNQVAVVAERLKRLGTTLEAARNRYNDTVTAMAGQQGLYGKVARLGEISTRVNRRQPALQAMHGDFDDQRLDRPAPPADETDNDPDRAI